MAQWILFKEALAVFNNDSLHPLVKSAYLDFVISVYMDASFNDSGIDIDNLWQCFVSGN